MTTITAIILINIGWINYEIESRSLKSKVLSGFGEILEGERVALPTSRFKQEAVSCRLERG